MFQVEMSASVRTETGKGAMRKLRSAGQTPAVVYGIGDGALALQLDTKTLMKQLLEYARKNTVVTMKVDGQDDKNVLIKEVQTDPIKDTLVHADFQEIDIEKQREFTVPVEYVGKAKGIDLGGEKTVYVNSIVLKGKPLDIPDSCTVDITPLAIGDSIKVGDIVVPETVTLVSNPKKECVAILAPSK